MILDDLAAHLRRYIAYPNEWAADAHALWITHTHVVEEFDNTPRLSFISPEPGSGKSRALEVTEPLVPRPVLTVNATPAYIFRKVSEPEGLPTILMDEADAVFSTRKADANEDLRGLINSGYRRGAVAGRVAMVGKQAVLEDYPSFCAVALAGLGDLPETILTRSVVIRMKRRHPAQTIHPYRRRIDGIMGDRLGAEVAEWAESIRGLAGDMYPDLPPGIEDRNADVWEPLICIADIAGEGWPERARHAALAAIHEAKVSATSLGIRLLTDIRRIWDVSTDHMATESIVQALLDLDDAPWAILRDGPLTGRKLATLLDPYDLKPTQKRTGALARRGYYKTAMTDAWERYCPPLHPPAHVTSVTSVTPANRTEP